MATLVIPNVVSHTLHDHMWFVSKSLNNSNPDIYDPYYQSLLWGLKPQGYRLFGGYNNWGTPSNPSDEVAPHNPFGQVKYQWVDFPQIAEAGHAAAGIAPPYFHFFFLAHPPSFNNTTLPYYNIVDGVGYSSNPASEGSTTAARDWAAYWYSQPYGARVLLIELYNEPATLGDQGAGSPNANWYVGTVPPIGGANTAAEAAAKWAVCHSRLYVAQVKTAAGYNPTKHFIGAMASGDASFLNSPTGSAEDVLGLGYTANFPYPTNNIIGDGYTVYTHHGYDHSHDWTGHNARGPFQDHLNATAYPLVSPGDVKSGWMAMGDYTRDLMNANGGSAIPISMTEVEPPGTSGGGANMPGGSTLATKWGKLGYGGAFDAIYAVQAANRHGRNNYLHYVWMDACRDVTSISTNDTGILFCVYDSSKSGDRRWIRAPRYFAARDLWGEFLREYPRITTIPMHSGDTAAASYTVPPGVSPSTALTTGSWRKKIAFGRKLTSNDFGILIVDIGDDQVTEAVTLDLSAFGTPNSVTARMMHREYATFIFNVNYPNPIFDGQGNQIGGATLYYDGEATKTTVSGGTGNPANYGVGVPTASVTPVGNTIVTGSGGCPVSGPASTMLIKGSFGGPPPPTLPVNIVPPSISGIARQGQVLTASPGTWTD